MPEQGRITATVDVLPDPSRRDDPDAPVKVRAIIWSGPDFKTATLTQGAIFEDAAEGRDVAEKWRDGCRMLGIPIEGDEPSGDHAQPILPEKRPESEYDRL